MVNQFNPNLNLRNQASLETYKPAAYYIFDSILQNTFGSEFSFSLYLFHKGLKNHAVTMFEVGKLSDESLDSLLSELEKVRDKVRC